ncbi:hypothetical protein GG344DRAFT_70099 [Lentinula edodes]|nr:hypothetical protein GG344DRAFT_70099 [Lentinula edodes]
MSEGLSVISQHVKPLFATFRESSTIILLAGWTRHRFAVTVVVLRLGSGFYTNKDGRAVIWLDEMKLTVERAKRLHTACKAQVGQDQAFGRSMANNERAELASFSQVKTGQDFQSSRKFRTGWWKKMGEVKAVLPIFGKTNTKYNFQAVDLLLGRNRYDLEQHGGYALSFTNVSISGYNCSAFHNKFNICPTHCDPPLSECSHLTSIDSILSIPPHTVSLGVEGYDQQALHTKSKDVQHNAVTQYICNVGFGSAGKSDKQGDYPTPQGPVARTKESLGTLKPTSDVQTIFDMIRRFPLDDCNESSEDGSIRWETTDKNTKTEYYKQNEEGHSNQQPPSPRSSDAVLSCWETCPQFSYHECNLGTFGPAPCQRGSSTIPDREHDLIVHQQCYAPRMNHKVLTPDPLNIPQVQMREVEDLEKNQFLRICMRMENVQVPPVEAQGKQHLESSERR